MPELIYSKDRKARKKHSCSYCNGIIEKGEIYEHSVLKYAGEIYDWDAHKECKFISTELYEYIDPWDGMTEDDFQEGCRDFCLTFVCPDCPHYEKEYHECAKDGYFCIDKIYELLKKYELVRVKAKDGYHWTRIFKLKERDKMKGGE